MEALLRLLAGLALCAGLATAQTSYNASDYRIYGHMSYRSAMPQGCDDHWVVACAAMGELTVRASPADLRILPPATGWALYKGKMISCSTGDATISRDSSGKNAFASGSFPSDKAEPELVPVTPFTMLSGGGDHMLQMRIPATACILSFELTDATNYVLDTQPTEWRSIFSAATQSSTPVRALVLVATAAVLLATWVLG